MKKEYIILSILGFYLYMSRYSLKGYVVRATKNWTTFDPLFEKYAVRYSVPSTWLKAICMNESSLGLAESVRSGLSDPLNVEGSKSYDGKSWGLMQVTLTTARDMDISATPQKLNNAEYSIDLGARYVAQMMRRFDRNDPRYIEWVIKSYNQGPGNTDKERKGSIQKGYADEYWARFQRNLKLVKGE